MSMTQIEPFGVFRRPTSSWHTSPWVHSTVPAPVVASSDMTSARAGTLGQRRGLLDLDAERGGERLDGLNAACRGARQDPADGKAGERVGQRRRLPSARRRSSGRSWSSPLHFRAVAGDGVAYEQGQHAYPTGVQRFAARSTARSASGRSPRASSATDGLLLDEPSRGDRNG